MLVHKSKRKEHEEEMLGSSSGLHGYTASLKKKKGERIPSKGCDVNSHKDGGVDDTAKVQQLPVISII